MRGPALLLAIAVTLATLVTGRADAAISDQFTSRFDVNANGAIMLRGNSNLTCSPLVLTCASARNGGGPGVTGNLLNNNSYAMVNTDADGDPVSTFNDSSSTVTLPPGSSVLFAGLYWGALTDMDVGVLPAPSPGDKNKVRFRTPGATSWNAITADDVYTTSNSAYEGFADVTALVAGGGNGVYSVANIQAATGTGTYAGWALIIAYGNAAEALRSLRVYDGFGSVTNTDVDIPLTGFETPHSGTVHTEVGAVAFEGDLGTTGDSLKIDGQTLSDAANPPSPVNIFNSTVSEDGAIVGGRDPSYRNLLGVDIDQFDASGKLGHGVTQAKLTMSTTGDVYYPGVLTVAIDLYAPKITTTMTGTDVNGGDLVPGDEIEYRIVVRNEGSDTADGVHLSDAIPTYTTYVSGGQYSAGAVTFDLGSIPYLGTTTVTFRVKVALDTPALYAIANMVNVTYTGRTTNVNVAAVGGTLATTVQQPRNDLSAGLAVSPADVQRAAAPNPIAYTATVTNLGPDPEPAARVELTLPPGVTQGTLPAGCTVAAPVVSCPAGQLVSGSKATVTIPATASAGAATAAMATLRVSGSGRDSNAANDTATATLRVNSPPVAVADTATTAHATPVTFAVRDNDTDPEDPNTGFTVTIVTPPAHGSAVVLADYTVRYTPVTGWAGPDPFTYAITDGHGGTATGTATVTTANAPPVANVDVVGTPPDTLVTLLVLANDTDPNPGDTLHVTSLGTVSPASAGVLSRAGDLVSFQPANGFSGRASFTYTADDGHGGQATGQVYVDVQNAAPTAADDVATTAYLTGVLINVLGNDRDPNLGDTISISAVGTPSTGTAAAEPGGIRYQPPAGFSGVATFRYDIRDNGGLTSYATVTVTVGNAQPAAANRAATTAYGTAAVINVLSYATDPNPTDTLSVTGTTDPAYGSVARNLNGTLTYTPDVRFSGTDFFDYTIGDGHGGTATARVTVTVANGVPVARADSVTVRTNLPEVIDVLANDDEDPNGTPLIITVSAAPAHGTAAVGPGNKITYTPGAGFHGTDAFDYTLSDGLDTSTATVTVGVVNSPPIARPESVATDTDTPVIIEVLANDEDPNGDALSLSGFTAAAHGTVDRDSDDTVVYTPSAGFYGIDAFTYTIEDTGRLAVSATVTITVRNAAPIAEDDAFVVRPEIVTEVDVLANDHDPNIGQPLAVSSVGPAAEGTAALTADGTVTYRADADSPGTDTFTYVLTDDWGRTGTATVHIAVDWPPLAVDDEVTTPSRTPIEIPVLANDTDPEGQPLTVTSVGAPSRGTATILPAGSIRYLPQGSSAQIETFAYAVRDQAGNTASAQITVHVDQAVVPPPAPTTVPPASPSPTTTPTPTTSPTATTNPTTTTSPGSPTASTSPTATARPTATSPSPPSPSPYQPVVPDKVAAAAPGRPIGIPLPATDRNGRPVTVQSVGKPAHGTAVLNADGTVTYTPPPGFTGVDSFTYEVIDANGNIATATITVTVGKPDQLPGPGILPLPATGDNVLAMIAAGAVTLTIGGVLLWLGKPPGKQKGGPAEADPPI
ncbi:Ig-like domain-containing protein [Paractinoplanes atraurantiacus]|uniref:Conserved repeat domain-containing protein n=1 Tax=Paractinoplanes atraurantiacus TaxID=1036182 RepID=A0A285F365_9ACTN|nr:Ig-like domain-containing protein [Actinoplanes atraurantiacus]SNY04806.1 conserved repeat domain-containing protein [Actinoplanes atraurantiacus]